MNINGYIKQNTDEEFSTLPFNYVDGLIFSELSYINFDLLLGKRKPALKRAHGFWKKPAVFQLSLGLHRYAVLWLLLSKAGKQPQMGRGHSDAK